VTSDVSKTTDCGNYVRLPLGPKLNVCPLQMSFFNVYLQALFPGILFNLPISVGNGTQEMLETQTNKLKTKQHMRYTASVT